MELLVRALLRPEAYPGVAGEIEHIETHISHLFLTPDRVYKLKKPVNLGFLDFTRLEDRRRFCEEEVRLNRELAPGIYLGVVPVVRTSEGPRVGAEGEPIEWAVEMRRLPLAGMLPTLLEEGNVDNQQMNALCDVLTEFHARAATGEGVDEHGSPQAVSAKVLENFAQTRAFRSGPEGGPSPALHTLSPRLHAFLEGSARSFLGERWELLRERASKGFVREGHGDLHAGNICLTGGEVFIYDRIEFCARFRCGDVAEDLAFLAMDLDSRGYPGFSGYLVHRYARGTGDRELENLLPFYKSYRAVVRAKIASLAASAPALDPDGKQAKRREAMSYFQLAAGYELAPRLILMCGLPATGKTWAARHLARIFRGQLMRSDVRRRALSGSSLASGPTGYARGLYSRELKQKTYRELLRSAAHGLIAGRSVVVDATFSRCDQRRAFVDAAMRLDIPVHLVELTAAREVVRERLERRAHDPLEASQADWNVYLRSIDDFEPPDELPPGSVCSLDSSGLGREELGAAVIESMLASSDGEPEPRAGAPARSLPRNPSRPTSTC